MASDSTALDGLTTLRPRLAIVIPTLDEERTLERTLACAQRIGDRVVVSDGGSRDATVALARHAGVEVVIGTPGRGGQLNRGAAAAGDADALLFLHADTTLPADAADAVRRALAGGAPGGGFRIAFDSERPAMRLAARLINARTALTRTPLGDQAIFASRAAFDALGGFQPWPILEDLDFAWRLRGLGRTAILAGPATTGARRFLARGVARTVATNWLIWGLFFCGISPQRLSRLYRVIR